MSTLPTTKLRRGIPVIQIIGGRKLAFVDAEGRAFWFRAGPRCRDEDALQQLRRAQDEHAAKASGILLPKDAG